MNSDLNAGYLIITLYLIICGNFMAPLLSCSVQNALEKSMFLRHIIGLLTFIFFVGLTNIKKKKFSKILLQSLQYYFLFILTTRMDIRFWIPFILCFAVLFLLENYKNIEELDEKEKQTLEPYEHGIFVLSIVILVFGVLTYLGAKKIEYQSFFSIVSFIFGNPSCRKQSPTLTIYQSLKGLVKFF
jgi:hypothetical protein